MPDDADLHKMLREDVEDETDADALLPLMRRLRVVPPPSEQTTQTLIASLAAHLPPRQGVSVWRYAVLLLYSQLRVIGRDLWLLSTLVMTLGVVVTLGQPAAHSPTDWLFAMCAPLVAAAGAAYLYDGGVALMLEIESTSRASARLLLLARLTLLFAFNLSLALIGSLLLAALRAEITLLALIMAWLAPMTFLAALAFLLSILTADSLIAAAFSLLLWCVHLIFRHSEHPLLALRGLSDPSWRLVLLLSSLLLASAALWLTGFWERNTKNNL